MPATVWGPKLRVEIARCRHGSISPCHSPCSTGSISRSTKDRQNVIARPGISKGSPVPPAITRELAAYATRSRFATLPEHVRTEGARAFLNWMGCVLGGCREPAVEIAAAIERTSLVPLS